MLCGYIVTKLKNTFDSLVCEFTAKAGEGGIVSRCRCNICAIGNRSASSAFCFSASCMRKYFAFSSLRLVHVVYATCSYFLRCSCFELNTSASEHAVRIYRGRS